MTPARLIAGILAAGLAAWLMPGQDAGISIGSATATTMPAVVAPTAAHQPAPVPTRSHDAALEADSTSAAQRQILNLEAVQSLRDTLRGDPRAPRIAKDMRQRETDSPTDSPDTTIQHPLPYQLTQARNARFVFAAAEKLAEIDEQLAWGKQNGVSAEQLRRGEEKRARLAAARDRLLENDPTLATHAPDAIPLEQK